MTMLPLPSPLEAEEFLTAPAGGAQYMIIDCNPAHRLVNNERYLRITTLSGETFRLCSTCVLRLESGDMELQVKVVAL